MVKVRFSDYMFELLSMDFCDQEFKKNVRIISNNGFIINIGNLPCGLGLLSSSLGGQALLLNLLDMDRYWMDGIINVFLKYDFVSKKRRFIV